MPTPHDRDLHGTVSGDPSGAVAADQAEGAVGPTSSPGPAAAAALDHVAVFVSDLDRAREFFVRFFAATSNERYHNPRTGLSTYFLSFEGGSRLEIMNRPDVHDVVRRGALGWNHVGFRMGSTTAVDDLTEQMRRAGHTVVSGPRTTGDGYYESCIAVDDDVLVELVA